MTLEALIRDQPVTVTCHLSPVTPGRLMVLY